MEITVGLLGSVPAEDISICAPVVSILAAAVADEHVLRRVAGAERLDGMIEVPTKPKTPTPRACHAFQARTRKSRSQILTLAITLTLIGGAM